MTTVMTVHLFNRGYHIRQNDTKDGPEQELDRIYKKWRVETCVIGSKLHAYFPNKQKDVQLYNKWDRFSERLSTYYEDSKHLGSKNSQELLHQLEERKQKLFDEKAELIEEILASSITGFRD